MSGEDHELPEGLARPNESEAEKQRQLVSFLVLSDTVTALEEGKLSLTMAVKSLKDHLEQHKQDARDVYYYLNQKCDNSYEVIATLEEQLLSEQNDREVEEKRYEQRYLQTVGVAEVEQQRLNAVIKKQAEKLGGLDDFMAQKEEMEEQMVTLKATLERERQENKTVLKELDLSWTIERDKLKKRYDAALAALYQEMDDKLVGKMMNKTKDIHTRNLEMTAELQHQSKQADQVLIYNQLTVDKDRQQRVELELSASAEEEMSKKLVMYQRMLKELNAKMVAAEEAQQQLAQKQAALEGANNSLRAENEKLLGSSKASVQYRAGKVVHFALSVFKDMIGEAEYRLIVESQFLAGIQNDTDVSKKHETTLVRLVSVIISRFPALFEANGSKGTAASISFFPAVSSSSPSPKAGGASKGLSPSPKRQQPPRITLFSKATIATQTDEQRVPVTSDSMWITGAKPRGSLPGSVSSLNPGDERSEAGEGMLFQGGNSQWGGGGYDNASAADSYYSGEAQSILNSISIKSSSAIPRKPQKSIDGSPQRRVPRGGVGGSLSVDGSGGGMENLSMKAKNRKILAMKGTPLKLASRPDKREYFKGGGGSGDETEAYRCSPQSSVSMSPRLRNDDDTIGTVSPRYDEEGEVMLGLDDMMD